MTTKLKVHDGNTQAKVIEIKPEYKPMTENKLICPFCNETELEKGIELQGGGFILGCPKCKKFAHDVFWQELITTRKALDVAVDALKELRPTEKRYCFLVPTVFTTQRTIDETLEQINEITKGGK